MMKMGAPGETGRQTNNLPRDRSPAVFIKRGETMNFSNFRLLIGWYKSGFISEELFKFSWAWEQRKQGITPQRGRFVRP
jgi:hypothetical protein